MSAENPVDGAYFTSNDEIMRLVRRRSGSELPDTGHGYPASLGAKQEPAPPDTGRGYPSGWKGRTGFEPDSNRHQDDIFVPGGRVEYWSETHQRWVETRIHRVHEDGTVDVDVKRGAMRSKIRPCGGEGPQGGTPPVRLGSDGQPWQPSPGERVEYKSDTFHRWVEATIIRVNSATVDLDVKRGALLARCRPLTAAPAGPEPADKPPKRSRSVVLGSSGDVGDLNSSQDLRNSWLNYFSRDDIQVGGPSSPKNGASRAPDVQIPPAMLPLAAHDTPDPSPSPPLSPIRADSHRPSAASAPVALQPGQAPQAQGAVGHVAVPQAALQAQAPHNGYRQPLPVVPAAAPPPPPAVASVPLVRPPLTRDASGPRETLREAPQVITAGEAKNRTRFPSDRTGDPSPQVPMQGPAATGGPGAKPRGGQLPLQGALKMAGDRFDPNALLPQILSGLGFAGQAAQVEAMQGFTGGLNDGVWFLTVQTRVYALKLVTSSRKFPTLPTEAENLTRLSRAFPHIRDDDAVAFPLKIFDCITAAGKKVKNLIVMRKADGQRFAEWIGSKVNSQRSAEVFVACESLGKALKMFHQKYPGSQHTDFQPSNIYYVEPGAGGAAQKNARLFTFIDIGGMGAPVMESDKDHFIKSLEILGKAYGQPFVRGATQAFQKGLASS